MKRKGIILTAVFVLWHLCCGILLASPTTAYQAEKLVKGWLKTAANPLGTPLGQQVKEVKTFTNNSKQLDREQSFEQQGGLSIFLWFDKGSPIYIHRLYYFQ